MQSSSDKYLKSDMTRDELAVIYSVLILADDDIPVTCEKIQSILAAANVTVEPIWPSLFSKALDGMNLRDTVRGLAGMGGMGGGVGVAVPGAAPAAAAEAKPVEEAPQEAPKPVEDDEDSDDDFGLSLFD
eukprot:GHVU01076475.1.p1 GENE.GHVU01076475.1~~GHVU01076475.1.p1  ORF type:complete len:130 (+),score=33.83 GHVU01076475.1:115-504(+)